MRKPLTLASLATAGTLALASPAAATWGHKPPTTVPPTADAPVLVDHSCDAVGSYTIPDSTDAAYMVTTDVSGGAKIRRFPGTYYATSDFLDPTSDPVFGITLTVEALWLEDPTTQLGSWSITFTEPTGCDDDPPVDEPVDEEPVDETPVDEEPADAPVDEEITPEPLPVIVPADPPVVEVSSQVETAETLAFTGSNTVPAALTGAGLVAFGAAALAVARRREVRS